MPHGDTPSAPSPLVPPDDEHNRRLLSHVHPRGWRNPAPASIYDLVVIGAGTAGLVSAVGAAALGARVALVEARLLGGDCLNTGCVPSKALIRAARAVEDIRGAKTLGIRLPGPPEVDFSAVMERVRRVRSDMSLHDSAERMRSFGIHLYFGRARFVAADMVEVNGAGLRFVRAVVATGASPVVPAIPGLSEAKYHTSETVFTLTRRPERLAVLGGGPLGCELAQAFQRLGSHVTLLHRHASLLDREDPEASAVIEEVFRNEGMDLLPGVTTHSVETVRGEIRLHHVTSRGAEGIVTADVLLIGAGRRPNVTGLGLGAAGIEHDPRSGIHVNDHLQTTNPRVYAAGDVCLRHRFTHAADAAARVVIRNALFPGRARLSALTIPRVTYTDPEVASVGMTAKEAAEARMRTDTVTASMAGNDRARLDANDTGFARILLERGNDRIVGATIVGRHAGETIGEITLAMTAGLRLRALAGVIHPYPTRSETLKNLVDAHNRTRLAPWLRRAFSLWFSLRRRDLPRRVAARLRTFRHSTSP